jgi:type VI secretion system protein ImpE
MAMIQADDLLRSGDLDGARRVLVEAARRTPEDVPTRLFLWQLLAAAGEWTKAKAQLQALVQMSPGAQMLGVVYGQAIDAEAERAAVFAGTATAVIHGGSEWAGGIAEALQLEANGQKDAAQAARDAAFDAAPDTPGEIDGTRFEWLADADARFGPVLEAIIGGRYGLLPLDAVAVLDSEGPRDLRDLVWYPAEITFRAGSRIAALLPARYPGLPDDSAERVARATGWRHRIGPAVAGNVGRGRTRTARHPFASLRLTWPSPSG